MNLVQFIEKIEVGIPRHHKRVPLLVIIIILFTPLLISLNFWAKGFIPRDDALRHVGKVFAEKAWHDVLELKDSFPNGYDPHKGWHVLLSSAGTVLGNDKEMLLMLSIVVPVFLIMASAILFLRRPEAFLLAMLILIYLNGLSLVRLMLGRPFLVGMLATLIFLFLWDRYKNRPWDKCINFAVMVVTALQVWIHGNWYLLALPIFSYWACGIAICNLAPAIAFTAAVVIGIVAGAILTLHPIDTLWQPVLHAISALNPTGIEEPTVVAEFRPAYLQPRILYLVLILIVVRAYAAKPSSRSIFLHPSFILFIIGWILTFFVQRFWLDWGVMGLAVWLAYECELLMRKKQDDYSLSRLFTTAFFATILCLAANHQFKVNHEETMLARNTNMALLQAGITAEPSILPEEDGILYNAEMGIFYSLLYLYPLENFRYAVGFEPGLMPQEDFLIYQAYQKNKMPEELIPWVSKMKDIDRLAFIADSKFSSDILEQDAVLKTLEWVFIPPHFWFGIPNLANRKP